MRLDDFIKKEKENVSLQSVGKTELISNLVNGLSDEIKACAQATYEKVCSDIAKKIARGSRSVSGSVGPDTEMYPSNLPFAFTKYGTSEVRSQILNELGISQGYSDMDGGYYRVPFVKYVKTRIKHENAIAGGDYATAAKMVTTCLWNVYECELKKLLSSEGISYEFKVPVIADVPGKGSIVKNYTSLNQEFDFRFLQMWTAKRVCLALELHYSYTRK